MILVMMIVWNFSTYYWLANMRVCPIYISRETIIKRTMFPAGYVLFFGESLKRDLHRCPDGTLGVVHNVWSWIINKTLPLFPPSVSFLRTRFLSPLLSLSLLSSRRVEMRQWKRKTGADNHFENCPRIINKSNTRKDRSLSSGWNWKLNFNERI